MEIPVSLSSPAGITRTNGFDFPRRPPLRGVPPAYVPLPVLLTEYVFRGFEKNVRCREKASSRRLPELRVLPRGQ